MAAGKRRASSCKPHLEDPSADSGVCNRSAASLGERSHVGAEEPLPGLTMLLVSEKYSSVPSGVGKTDVLESYLEAQRADSDLKERALILMRVPTTAGGNSSAIVLDESQHLRTTRLLPPRER